MSGSCQRELVSQQEKLAVLRDLYGRYISQADPQLQRASRGRNRGEDTYVFKISELISIAAVMYERLTMDIPRSIYQTHFHTVLRMVRLRRYVAWPFRAHIICWGPFSYSNCSCIHTMAGRGPYSIPVYRRKVVQLTVSAHLADSTEVVLNNKYMST